MSGLLAAVTGNATGIDVSDFQSVLTVAYLDSLGISFAYCKATEGVSITDDNLTANWAVLGSWGQLRGLYHEFVPQDDPAAQAQYCYAQAQAAGGFRPGDMAAVVASDYTGTTGAEIAAWCTQMQTLAGPQVAVQVYSDLSVLPQLASCTGWPLWVAWPNQTPPTAAQVAPWTSWTFWQNGQQGTDTDQFNGPPAALEAWIAALTGSGKDSDSMLIIPAASGKTYLLDGGRLHHVTDSTDLALYTSAPANIPQLSSPVSADEEAQLLADFPPGNPAVTVNSTGASYTITGTATPAAS
jgi:lysozyme